MLAVPGSPAVKAGIKEGDVVTKFNGQVVDAVHKLPRIVADTELGSNVPVEIYRNGKTSTVTVTLTEMTAEQEKADANSENLLDKTTALTGRVMLGMKLVEITAEVKERYKLIQDKGLLVADVSTDSNAATNGIRSGVVITKAGQKSISSLNDFGQAIAETRKARRDSILVLIQNANGSEERFVPVSLK